MSAVVIVGSGLAGLTTAWALAPQPCVLITSGLLTGGAASMWAQGGVAAALGSDDRPALHAQDTFVAGARYGDRHVIDRVTTAAPDVVRELARLGVPFDRTPSGDFDLALEGGHGRHRVAHAGDHSGATITSVMAALVATLPSVTVREFNTAVALTTNTGHIDGIDIRDERTGLVEHLPTERVVLATGGVGGLYAHTTNPITATGRGVALAARIGARTDDLHLVQFHPTALDVGADPMPLLTEALRGAGAVLLADGERFVDELQPRDIVAAAVWEQLTAGRRVVLDAREIDDVTTRFPSVTALAAEHGLDITSDLLPVRPALHFSMGGITTDARAHTSVLGLWAVGECSRTGLHGANRLASNSLLEAVVTGKAAAASAASYVGAWPDHADTDPDDVVPSNNAPEDLAVLALVRETLDTYCGVLRDADGLHAAVDQLAPFIGTSDAAYVGWLIARSALAHPLSVGAHRRTDEPVLAVSA